MLDNPSCVISHKGDPQSMLPILGTAQSANMPLIMGQSKSSDIDPPVQRLNSGCGCVLECRLPEPQGQHVPLPSFIEIL